MFQTAAFLFSPCSSYYLNYSFSKCPTVSIIAQKSRQDQRLQQEDWSFVRSVQKKYEETCVSGLQKTDQYCCLETTTSDTIDILKPFL